MSTPRTSSKRSSVLAMGIAMCMVAFMGACTDLTEPIDSQVTAENFFQTDQQFVSALGDAYSTLTNMGGAGAPNVLNEVTSDEVIVPARGQDWSEGGVWFRRNNHTWFTSEFNGVWTTFFAGINAANRLIFQFESAVAAGAADPDAAATFISELQALRAYYYYNLLDAFGNVPIVTSFADAEETPSQPSSAFAEGRRAVFEFVEQELLGNIDNLSANKGATYGRMNRYVAHMTLAKLYLNAEVYTGTARWNDALTQLDAIINSGQYSLSPGYHDNFSVANEGSPESIFVVPYDGVFLTGFSLHQASLHYGSQNTFNFQFQPWNGWSATQKIYESVTDPVQNPGPQGEVWGSSPTATDDGLDRIQGTLDDRLGNFIVGPQYSSGGDRVLDTGVFSDFDANGPPLTFTPEFNDLEAVACRQCGARIGKYQFELGIGSNMSNDYLIYRYATVLLDKAEALWRLNPGNGEALALVNQIRTRSGVDPFDALTAERLLAERGRELFWEQVRRQDLIRFAGTNGGETQYNDPWKFKDVSPSFRNVAPIPDAQLQTNPNLVQNPGY